ncbi:MAG: hypothetical protein Q7S27_00170 [Nanoarchaeota archaeon]|nr:hypothetical protein [Nanoarchaeota archaeon]
MEKRIEGGNLIIKMTFTIKRKEMKRKEPVGASFSEELEDYVRAGARGAYTALPIAGYVLSSDKLGEIDKLGFSQKLIANIFYGGDISRLNEFNDYSAKGIGLAGASLGGYGIDRLAESIFPKSAGLRNTLKTAGYFIGANIANVVSKGMDGVKSLGSLEGLIANAQNTLATATDTLYNIANTGNGTDAENAVNTGIAGLTALAGIKGINYMAKSELAKGMTSFVKDMTRELYGLGKFTAKIFVGKPYSWILGDRAEKYENRRISKLLDKKSQKLQAEADNIKRVA